MKDLRQICKWNTDVCVHCGGHNPTVAAASTQRSRSPAPSSRKRGDKRGGNARPKSHPPSHPDFHSFQNPGNGMCKFHNYYANRANRCILPCSWLENEPLSVRRLSPHMPLSRLCIFPQTLVWFLWLTNWIWLILEQLWALFLATKIQGHLAPFSKGQMANPSPLGALLKKLCNFKANFLHQLFCKPLWLAPFWAWTFWENSRSLFLQNSAKYSLLVQQQLRPPTFCLQQLRPPKFCHQRLCPPRIARPVLVLGKTSLC